MKPLTIGRFEIRETDRRIFEREIKPYLPSRIIDAHVHVGLAEHVGPISSERLAGNWALEVGITQSWEELRFFYSALFPGIEVQCLAFGLPFREVNTPVQNDYLLAGALKRKNKAKALLVTRPECEAEVIEKALEQGFAGIKPYPDFAPQGYADCSIFDFLPHNHLSVVDRSRGVVMLHISRPGRLGDADNVRELKEISDKYPGIKLIVAHVGRAYCLPEAEKGLPMLSDRPGIFFDISANLNPDVFRLALQTVKSDRLLFGSDLPILLMRGVREHTGSKYINYTDLPFSWNTNRKSAEEEAGYTFYLYEELKAVISAVRAEGGGREEMEKIMFSNAAGLLGFE